MILKFSLIPLFAISLPQTIIIGPCTEKTSNTHDTPAFILPHSLLHLRSSVLSLQAKTSSQPLKNVHWVLLGKRSEHEFEINPFLFHVLIAERRFFSALSLGKILESWSLVWARITGFEVTSKWSFHILSWNSEPLRLSVLCCRDIAHQEPKKHRPSHFSSLPFCAIFPFTVVPSPPVPQNWRYKVWYSSWAWWISCSQYHSWSDSPLKSS